MKTNHSIRLFAFTAFACAGALVAHAAQGPGAQRITVDLALDDFVDFGGAQTFDDLPGPDGRITFREAVIAANNTKGPQKIEFAVPKSDWPLWNRVLVHLEDTIYVADDETTIDFSTQTAFTGDTNPRGNEVALQYAGPPMSTPCLWLAADRCVVRGLDVGFNADFHSMMWITGNENSVVGSTTSGLTIRGDYGGGAFNVIGGTLRGDRNVFKHGIEIIAGASDNVLIGNTFRQGVRITGDSVYGMCQRNRIGGPTAAERNVLAGYAWFEQDGFPQGAQLEIVNAVDTLVIGNFVGTTPDGMAKHPGLSGTNGITVGKGAVGTTLLDNVVSGFVMNGADEFQGMRYGSGIAVVASAFNTKVVGNRIGVAADGVTPIPNVEGMVVLSNPDGRPVHVHFGGNREAEANVVAYNESNGVRVTGGASSVAIRQNSIHDNGGLGIDLTGAVGIDRNDFLDGDTGANKLQNYPTLTGATRMRVFGNLMSAPGETFDLEFFANKASDPSGFGEGAFYVGRTSVTTDKMGFVTFVANFAMLVDDGMAITATATDIDGNTSEFSAFTTVGSPGLRPTLK